MAQHRTPQDTPGEHDGEARDLAEQAVARSREGARQEGEALAEQARALDKAAAEDVIRSGAKKPSG